MNTSKLKSVRIEQNKSTKYMGKIIGKTEDTYSKKERGLVKFSPKEMVIIGIDLHLSLRDFNLIFFDSQLPFGKSDDEVCTKL